MKLYQVTRSNVDGIVALAEYADLGTAVNKAAELNAQWCQKDCCFPADFFFVATVEV